MYKLIAIAPLQLVKGSKISLADVALQLNNIVLLDVEIEGGNADDYEWILILCEDYCASHGINFYETGIYFHKVKVDDIALSNSGIIHN